MLLIDLKKDGYELHMGISRDNPKCMRLRLMQRVIPGGNTLNWISTYHDSDVTRENDDYIDFEGDVPIQFLAKSVNRWLEREMTRLYPDVDPDITRFTPWLNQFANHLQDDYTVAENGSLERIEGSNQHSAEV